MQKQEVEAKLKTVVQEIATAFDPEKVILFGSWAWGVPKEGSDVDLFIVKKTNGQTTREVAREIDGSIFPRPFPVDVVEYQPQQGEERSARGDSFVTDVLTKGRVLYAR